MSEMALLEQIVQCQADGTGAALATVIHTRGHSPREVGAKMLIHGDGRTSGSIGGGSGEAGVIRRALRVIADGIPVVELVDLFPTPSGDGSVCGGRMEVFIERVASERGG